MHLNSYDTESDTDSYDTEYDMLKGAKMRVAHKAVN